MKTVLILLVVWSLSGFAQDESEQVITKNPSGHGVTEDGGVGDNGGDLDEARLVEGMTKEELSYYLLRSGARLKGEILKIAEKAIKRILGTESYLIRTESCLRSG